MSNSFRKRRFNLLLPELSGSQGSRCETLMGPRKTPEAPPKAPARLLARLVATALALAVCFGASAVHAQSTDTATSEALILTPLSIVKGADLDFGGIVRPAGAGTVILTPTPVTTCTTTGGLIRTGTCQAAAFYGYGAPNQIIRLNQPNWPLIVSNGAQTMSITGRTLDGDPNLVHVSGNPNGNGSVRYRIVSVDGLFSFRIGGTLSVAANQALGLYSGTFSVTVDYQ